MTQLPRLALAVRQPWAWAIIHAGKDLENRSWRRWIKDWKFRGRVAILASTGMTRDEYDDGSTFMGRDLGITCPPAAELIRGAIIGSVEIVDNVWQSDSPWFFGPGALVFRDPASVAPIVATGKLGFFEWHPSGKELPPTPKWMTRSAEEAML